MVNPETNQGYFLEIVALSQDVQNRGDQALPCHSCSARKERYNNYKGKDQGMNGRTNIEKGDQFLIMTTHLGIVGQWKAAGVGKSTISLRIENAQDGTYEAKVQKAEAGTSTMSTVFFYKMMQKDGVLVPYVLWEGIAEILCDDGKFTDIQRSCRTRKDKCL